MSDKEEIPNQPTDVSHGSNVPPDIPTSASNEHITSKPGQKRTGTSNLKSSPSRFKSTDNVSPPSNPTDASQSDDEKAVQFNSTNDGYAATDHIGFDPYVQAFAKTIQHEKTITPLTIGIYGPWGSGKTSFMRQIQKTIDDQHKPSKWKKNQIEQVWFNAWKYDRKAHVWASLLQTIVNQLEHNTNIFSRIWRRFKSNLSWFEKTRMLGYLFLIVIATFQFVNFSTNALTNSKEHHLSTPIEENTSNKDNNTALKNTNSPTQQALPEEPSNYQAISALIAQYLPTSWLAFVLILWTTLDQKGVRQIYRQLLHPLGIDIKNLVDKTDLPKAIKTINEFDQLLSKHLNDHMADNGRLIVYIDDLDRCTPPHVVEVIEAINLFTESKKCVFVVGVDDELVAQAINQRYSQMSEYFRNRQPLKADMPESHKVIRVEYRQRDNYGEIFLEKIIQLPFRIPSLSIAEATRLTNSLLEISTTTEHSVPRDESEALSKRIQMSDIELSEQTTHLVKVLCKYIEPNPRSMKRFINTLRFMHFLRVELGDDYSTIQDVPLTLWLFLMYRFPESMDIVANQHRAVGWKMIMSAKTEKLPAFDDINSFFSTSSFVHDFEKVELPDHEHPIEPYILFTRCIRL